MDLITVSNVRGYIDENGTAHLNLEDCARGLGFVTTVSGKEYIRWSTVVNYLLDVKFLQVVAKDTPPEFIPENVFYRLAMKARNEAAEKFQALIADEILPAIRRTGSYSVKPQFNLPATFADALRQLASTVEEKEKLTAKVEMDKPKVVFAESVECSKTSILIKGLATILKQNGIDIGQNRLFEWMREHGYISKRPGKTYNAPTQKSLELKIMEEKTTTINKPDREPIITNTPLITGKGQIYFVNKFLAEKEKTA